MIVNQTTIKYNVENDYANHQWILSYGEVKRVIDFLKSEDDILKVKQEMIAEHRDNQLKKLINDDENN